MTEKGEEEQVSQEGRKPPFPVGVMLTHAMLSLKARETFGAISISTTSDLFVERCTMHVLVLALQCFELIELNAGGFTHLL
jgi:hypothetical protein